MTKIHYKKLETVPKWFKHSKLVWGLSELISHLREFKGRVTKGTHVKWFYKHKGQQGYIIWKTGVRQDTIVMFDSDMCDRRQRTGNRWNRWNRWNRNNGLVGFQ
ncbi:uncharacterized protein EV154DRAFT_487763 [Mucor mucedo]|uniref:uncharacterized protein n=1 Tax=Mucor mucedo TaxID=29922 RepID=UPI00222065FB|nr:uncharacterized protein EV154DRAFT_487763 [Mucor mucedo]KAI7870705.1 hypothetical protein EV154DRAFT_487763 [Mucor mucedo]